VGLEVGKDFGIDVVMGVALQALLLTERQETEHMFLSSNLC
jgi:hypothetical protein